MNNKCENCGNEMSQDFRPEHPDYDEDDNLITIPAHYTDYKICAECAAKIADPCADTAKNVRGRSVKMIPQECKSNPTASGIIADYRLRDIKPANTQTVTQGIINIWYFAGQDIAAQLVMGDVMMTTPYIYRNTLHPQDIADDIYKSNSGDTTLAAISEINYNG